MSSTKSINETPIKLPNEVQVNNHKDVDDNKFNPRSLKFITIMIGMYMSVFLVALVCLSLPLPLLFPCHSIYSSLLLSYFTLSLPIDICIKRLCYSICELRDHLQPVLTKLQDRTILAVAIPAMTNDFHTISDIGWYGSSYMLTAACFNPIFGRIYALYSTKWCFLTSILIFEIGSAVCGAAPTSIAFIIGRAVAGVGSAGIFQGGMMVIVGMVPLSRRPMFTAVFGMAFGVCAVLGPIVGGAFTDHV